MTDENEATDDYLESWLLETDIINRSRLLKAVRQARRVQALEEENAMLKRQLLEAKREMSDG